MAPKVQNPAISTSAPNPIKLKPIKKTQKRSKLQPNTTLPFKFEEAETFTSLPDI